MAKIRLTKEFGFEMAHALEGYDGACRHIHGHSYRLFVTVTGSPCNDPNDPKYGMVIDFGDLKRIVNRLIIERYDHALVLRRTEAKEVLLGEMQNTFSKVVLTDYQPTCENMIARFAEGLSKELSGMKNPVRLHHLRLHETATSFAEWFAEDNE